MANSIDQLNYYDPLVKPNSLKMSEEWISQMSSFIDVLNGYLTPYGILLPNMTTAERASIQSPEEGQMIYNTNATVGPPRSAEIQVWQVKAGVGAWRTVTTVP
jgi:hypothetical protein